MCKRKTREASRGGVVVEEGAAGRGSSGQHSVDMAFMTWHGMGKGWSGNEGVGLTLERLPILAA